MPQRRPAGLAPPGRRLCSQPTSTVHPTAKLVPGHAQSSSPVRQAELWALVDQTEGATCWPALPFTSDTTTSVRYHSGEAPELSCQMWTPHTRPRLSGALLEWNIVSFCGVYPLQSAHLKALSVFGVEILCNELHSRLWLWSKHVFFDWSGWFHLIMKVSWEFLWNRLDSGTCSSLVCEAPSSPFSDTYTCQ